MYEKRLKMAGKSYVNDSINIRRTDTVQVRALARSGAVL